MKRPLGWVLLVAFLLPALLVAQEKPVITVLDFKISGVSQREMKSIISLLSSMLFKTGNFTVIDMAERETLLKEIEFSATDCVDESCQLEIGRQLSAERIVVGSIDKVGSKLVLSAKILQTSTDRTMSTADGIYQDLDDLLENIYVFGRDLAGSAAAQPAPFAGDAATVAEGDRFADNGDGTMTDTLTRLMWEKRPGGGDNGTGYSTLMDFSAGKAYAENLELGGHDDWRVPSIAELKELISSAHGEPATWLTVQGFTRARSEYYWSSTSQRILECFMVSLNDGGVRNVWSDKESHRVWAVRGPAK